jgi:hypothetical protein
MSSASCSRSRPPSRRRRNPELDTFTITASWTLLGTLAGVVVVAIEALLG